MAAVLVSTAYTMIGISMAFALSFQARRLARPGAGFHLVPRKAAPSDTGVLVRGRLMNGEAVAADGAPADRLRAKADATLPSASAGASRNGSTLGVALLGLVAAASYGAGGAAAAQWLLPCIGIPVIVALVNLLGSSDR